MSATIKDVARMADVSISTVSRVINDSKPVSSDVKQRVLEAIDELGYVPNEVARSLVTKKSNLIGVIVTDMGDPYVAEMVRGIEEIGRMYNFDILLSSSYNDLKTEIKFARLLRNKLVEGLIIISEDYNIELIDVMKKLKKPFLYLNRYNKSDRVYTVSLDNNLAIKDMMDYLIDKGHKKILYVSSNQEDSYSLEKQKKDSYLKITEDKGIYSSILNIDGYNVNNGYDVGGEVLQKIREDGVTAVFSSYSEIGIGLLNYFYDNDISVPEDVSVVGYGDIRISSLYRPRLTTLVEPYYDIGAVAIRKIIKDIKGEKNIDEDTYLPHVIFQGDSVKDLNDDIEDIK